MTPGAAGTASYHYRGETVAQDETDAAARLAEALGGRPETPWIAAALMPVVREIADQRSAELRQILADLVEAVGRGDEVGLPEAYRAAVAALRGEAGR